MTTYLNPASRLSKKKRWIAFEFKKNIQYHKASYEDLGAIVKKMHIKEIILFIILYFSSHSLSFADGHKLDGRVSSIDGMRLFANMHSERKLEFSLGRTFMTGEYVVGDVSHRFEDIITSLSPENEGLYFVCGDVNIISVESKGELTKAYYTLSIRHRISGSSCIKFKLPIHAINNTGKFSRKFIDDSNKYIKSKSSWVEFPLKDEFTDEITYFAILLSKEEIMGELAQITLMCEPGKSIVSISMGGHIFKSFDAEVTYRVSNEKQKIATWNAIFGTNSVIFPYSIDSFLGEIIGREKIIAKVEGPNGEDIIARFEIPSDMLGMTRILENCSDRF